MVLYSPTRGWDEKGKEKVTFSEAILNPAASFGGLYAPDKIPSFDEDFLKRNLNSSYIELSKEILSLFGVDLSKEVINRALKRYESFDDPSNPAPLVKIKDDLYSLELYHGPTRAFKDMALQPFGEILSSLAQEKGEDYLIMAATSGDTGPATLESFKNKANIKVSCIYPAGGTSDVQRLQMVTEDGKNLKVIGIEGDFDDAQSALKSLLNSSSFKETLNRLNIKLSAANSVNFGRIIFQIIYHIYSYLTLLRNNEIKFGEKIDIIVPSGNFGNALGAYYAKRGGLLIDKIIIASNENNILTDLITKGEYDLRGRELKKTIAPAMDILKSSNVERLLYDKFGANRVKELMESLEKNGFYKLTKEELDLIQEDFEAVYTTQEEIYSYIADFFEKYNYLMDSHTATCIKGYNSFRKDGKKYIICSTAEWTKFAPVVAKALKLGELRDKEALELISSKYNIKVSEHILKLFEKEIIHKSVISKDKIEEEILNFLNSQKEVID
ncbi:MAG: threonine synthase [Epsilonproteobacteria bacterium]|nr:threonine synthase [Campylobacterota bacterium]